MLLGKENKKADKSKATEPKATKETGEIPAPEAETQETTEAPAEEATPPQEGEEPGEEGPEEVPIENVVVDHEQRIRDIEAGYYRILNTLRGV